MLSTPCRWVCFTCKDWILNAIYMQITNNFCGEKKESPPKFLPPLKKAFMHPSTVTQEVCVHYTKYLQRYPFDKEWDFAHQANSRAEREAWVSRASLEALGRVCRWWLKLVGNVIVSRKSFTAVLHLREQLQGLLLLLSGVVAQEVCGCREDGGSACARHQVKTDGESDVYERAVVLFMLLL